MKQIHKLFIAVMTAGLLLGSAGGALAKADPCATPAPTPTPTLTPTPTASPVTLPNPEEPIVDEPTPEPTLTPTPEPTPSESPLPTPETREECPVAPAVAETPTPQPDYSVGGTYVPQDYESAETEQHFTGSLQSPAEASPAPPSAATAAELLLWLALAGYMCRLIHQLA